MVRVTCRSCNKPQITLGGYNLSDTCVYCGASIDDQVVEDVQNAQPIEENVTDPHAAEVRRMSVIHCWYCDYPNAFTSRQCTSCGANLFAVSRPMQEGDMNKRFVSQLTPSEQNMYLIEGIKAFIEAVLTREGNKDGLVRCQNRNCHGGMYHFSEFVCPRCEGPTLLQEMRGVLTGGVNSSEIARELQKSFPQFNILKYTNSAVMDHRSISAAKIDLEDAARQTASMLRTGAEFLKAVTYTGKRKSGGADITIEHAPSRGGGGLSNVFDMSDVNMEVDNSIMELIGAGPMRPAEAVGEASAANTSDEVPPDPTDALPSDWTNA